MIELESSPLLPVEKKRYDGDVSARSSSCAIFTRYVRGVSVGMTALLAGATVVWLAWASAGVFPGPPPRDDVAHTRAEMEAVFNLLVSEKRSYTLDCPGATYAYCGRAQCERSGEDGVSACGCKLVPNQAGRFQIDLASAVLMRSAAFRQGALQASDGNFDAAAVVVCSAILDGSMWSEAGFATNFGSFFHPHASSLGDSLLKERHSNNNSALHERRRPRRKLSKGSPLGSPDGTSSRGLHGSCMGSPCLSNHAWNTTAGCSVTCLCPDYRNPDDDTTSDGCFENGVLATIDYGAIMWAASLDAVLGYAGVLAEALSAFDAGELKNTEGTCNACTVV